jgi:hypothetical protein
MMAFPADVEDPSELMLSGGGGENSEGHAFTAGYSAPHMTTSLLLNFSCNFSTWFQYAGKSDDRLISKLEI